ncbi:uncharacterized protein LOC123943846 isoform X1 [Meles meles]|uniref:uncharacterized protein LOC123943846 isoform X1 n=1 Tax=Meles meles TaxID=9662 RepID=UPI001E698A79|nr:uncharacterized protein LOC123943846 isoform X1 [Meles meles]
MSENSLPSFSSKLRSSTLSPPGTARCDAGWAHGHPREDGLPVLGCAELGRVRGRSADQRGHPADGSARRRGATPGGLTVTPEKMAFLSSDARSLAGSADKVRTSAGTLRTDRRDGAVRRRVGSRSPQRRWPSCPRMRGAWPGPRTKCGPARAPCGRIGETARCDAGWAHGDPREDGLPVLGCAELGRVRGRSADQRGHPADGSARRRGATPGGLTVTPEKMAFLSSDARSLAGSADELRTSAGTLRTDRRDGGVGWTPVSLTVGESHLPDPRCPACEARTPLGRQGV